MRLLLAWQVTTAKQHPKDQKLVLTETELVDLISTSYQTSLTQRFCEALIKVELGINF